MEAERRKREAGEKTIADFTDKFLREHVTEEDVGKVRLLMMNAVEDGKFEAMVQNFSCDLCNDSGRAINSGSAHWPETLQGGRRSSTTAMTIGCDHRATG